MERMNGFMSSRLGIHRRPVNASFAATLAVSAPPEEALSLLCAWHDEEVAGSGGAVRLPVQQVGGRFKNSGATVRRTQFDTARDCPGYGAQVRHGQIEGQSEVRSFARVSGDTDDVLNAGDS